MSSESAPGDDGGPSVRLRLAVAAVSLAWGFVFFRVLSDVDAAPSLILGATAGVFYLLPNNGWGLAGRALAVGVFIGLGGWLAAGLGLWSLLAAAVASASFLGYMRSESQRQ